MVDFKKGIRLSVACDVSLQLGHTAQIKGEVPLEALADTPFIFIPSGIDISEDECSLTDECSLNDDECSLIENERSLSEDERSLTEEERSLNLEEV
jgi:hypothetical protein